MPPSMCSGDDRSALVHFGAHCHWHVSRHCIQPTGGSLRAVVHPFRWLRGAFTGWRRVMKSAHREEVSKTQAVADEVRVGQILLVFGSTLGLQEWCCWEWTTEAQPDVADAPGQRSACCPSSLVQSLILCSVFTFSTRLIAIGSEQPRRDMLVVCNPVVGHQTICLQHHQSVSGGRPTTFLMAQHLLGM